MDCQEDISNIAFRNDIDVVGVRAGCTFTGFTGSQLDGESGVIRGGHATDTWVVLERYFLKNNLLRTPKLDTFLSIFRNPAYAHLDENIESVNCTCS